MGIRSVEEFQKLNRLGQGTYGVVYRAVETSTRQIVALKRLRMDIEGDGAMPLSSLREISLLKRLRHENIVSLLDVVVGSSLDQVFMVMEYCEQDMGHLLDTVISKGPGYTPAQADFGLARPFGLPEKPLTPKVVTLWYRAPEVLYGSRDYSTAIDIWSAGCIFGEFIQSRPLLPGTSELGQLGLIHELLGSPSESIWPGFEKLPHVSLFKFPPAKRKIPYDSLSSVFSQVLEGTRSLLKRLLTYWPKGRLSASEALSHSYFVQELPRPCSPALLPTYPELRNNTDVHILESVVRAQKRRKREADLGRRD